MALIDIIEKEVLNPTLYLHRWDYTIFLGAMFLRLLIQVRDKSYDLKKRGYEFEPKIYFNFNRVVRGLIHFISGVLLLFSFPPFFVHIVQKHLLMEFPQWTVFGSGITGYLGYDAVKIIERAFKYRLSKLNIFSNDKT